MASWSFAGVWPGFGISAEDAKEAWVKLFVVRSFMLRVYLSPLTWGPRAPSRRVVPLRGDRRVEEALLALSTAAGK